MSADGTTALSDRPPIASRYRVLRELGRGGMGVVYVVEHIHTGDHLALKLLLGDAARDAKAVERFKREARASARIRSEHVVKVVDADVAPELHGAPFLVMELLNGVDLQKRLEAGGALSPTETIQYLTQAASALDKSHAAGIVHRDLKPENLFLHTREDGSTILKILDFGISKAVGGDTSNDILGASATKTGAIMGTPLYMSPEQARGRISEISPATDVWAMGLIGLQLLTGEIYWRANTVAELMSQILSEPFYPTFERWPSLGPAVDAWFQRSCARDPRARFATVGEQVATLAQAVGVAAPGLVLTGPSAYLTAASAVSLPGARTTTGAVSHGAVTADGARSRGGIGAVVGLVAAVGLAIGAFVAHSRTTQATVGATPSVAVAAQGNGMPTSVVADAPPSAPSSVISAPVPSPPTSAASAVASTRPVGRSTPRGTTPVASTPVAPSAAPPSVAKPAPTPFSPSTL